MSGEPRRLISIFRIEVHMYSKFTTCHYKPNFVQKMYRLFSFTNFFLQPLLISNLMHKIHIYLFTYNTFIKLLYMFRALPCSSSGGLRRDCIYAASGIVTVCRWLPCTPVENRVYTECPTRYRTRHFFNNFTTNEDITTKFEAHLHHCVRNVKEKNLLLFKFRCNIFIGVRIIKDMPGSEASGTLCTITT